jgi:heparin binding hemagglutinin HbhA
MTQPHHQKEQDMAKAKFDIKTVQTEAQKLAQQSAKRAFHAGVGVTDFAVEVVRDYVAGTQKRVAGVSKSVVDFEPRTFGVQTVKTVNDQVLAVPARVQKAVDSNVAVASDAYGDLVTRGRTLVGRIRRQQSTKDAVAAAETTVTKAKTTRTQATKAAKKTTTAAKKTAKKSTTTAKKSTGPSRSSAKATRTSAKKTVSSASRALTDAAAKVGD